MSKILVVDDEKQTVELIRLVLEQEGHEIFSALSGDDALRQLATRGPSLVLLDITMPGMDGYTLMSHIQAEEATRDVPVMILTGRDGMKDAFQVFTNVVDYVVKPFDIKDLRERVQKALQRPPRPL